MADNQDTQQDITIAVIKNDLEYIKREVGGITGALKILENNYMRRVDVESVVKDLSAEDKRLDKKLEVLKLEVAVFKTQIYTWGAAAILVLGIVQFIISKFF